MCKKDTIDRCSPDHKSRKSSLSNDSLTQQELSSTVSSRQNNKAITTTTHTTTMDNEEGSSSTCAAVDDPTEKMIVFLTGKPSSERSRYDKAFKFPVKLFYVLECGEYEHVLSWLPDGRAFRVFKPDEFASKVLPGIFRQAKFSSFHRKLNRWNFVKVPGQQGTYSHPRFIRGQLVLCKSITCSRTDGSNSQVLPEKVSAMLIQSELNRVGANQIQYPPLIATAHGNGGDLQFSVNPPSGLNAGIPLPSLLKGGNQSILYQGGSTGSAVNTYPGASNIFDALRMQQSGNVQTQQSAVASDIVSDRISALENELLQYQQMRRLQIMASAAQNSGFHGGIPSQFTNLQGSLRPPPLTAVSSGKHMSTIEGLEQSRFSNNVFGFHG